GSLLAELWRRIARRVDLAAKSRLCLPQRGRKVCEADVTDHHQVDVARRMLVAARDRPVDKRTGDPPVQWTKDLPQGWHDAGGLVDQAAQLGKDRRLRVRLEIRACTLPTGFEDAPVDERFELTLEARRRGPDKLRQLGEVPPLLRLRERRRQDITAKRRKQCSQRGKLTHIA